MQSLLSRYHLISSSNVPLGTFNDGKTFTQLQEIPVQNFLIQSSSSSSTGFYPRFEKNLLFIHISLSLLFYFLSSTRPIQSSIDYTHRIMHPSAYTFDYIKTTFELPIKKKSSPDPCISASTRSPPPPP